MKERTLRFTSAKAMAKLLIGVFALVAAVVGGVIWLGIATERTVEENARQLVDRHIPELDAIGAMQAAVGAQVNQLYLYYATTNSSGFRDASESLRAKIRRQSMLLARAEFVADHERLTAHLKGFDEAVASFDREMAGPNRDWDALREHLAVAQKEADSMQAVLNELSGRIQSAASAGGSRTLEAIARLAWLQTSFNLSVVVVSAFILVALYGWVRYAGILAHRAYHDDLTELPNRRKLEKDLAGLLAESRGKAGGLILVNPDRLKLLSGTFGHAVVDALIVAFTRRLQEALAAQPDSTRLYSFSNGTWAILFRDDAARSGAQRIGKLLPTLTATPLTLADRDFTLAVSAGLAAFPADGDDPATLFRNADAALRLAQAAGGNRLHYYSREMSEQAVAWLSTEAALRQALTADQFELHYQPKIAAASGAVAGSEALIRWRRDGRLESPAVFIPVAEESGLIVPIGDWVLQAACRQWMTWRQAGLPALPVAVNISAQQFQQPDFPAKVAAALAATGMPAASLELEITEAVAADHPEKVVATMAALKATGVTLAIDDFGTGYSSLSYLKRFPLDTLKIDQSFVRAMESNANDATIVHLILGLARELGFKVVAEGVETERQRRLLADGGCDLLQGYLFSRPLPAAEFAAFVAPATTP